MTSGPVMMKRKKRFEQCISLFPDRAEFYIQKIKELDEQLQAIKACRICGRPLKGEKSQLLGIGPECAKHEEGKHQ